MNRKELERAAPAVEKVEGLLAFFNAGVLNLDRDAINALGIGAGCLMPSMPFEKSLTVLLSEKSIRMEKVDGVFVIADETAAGNRVELNRKVLTYNGLLDHTGGIIDGLLADGRIDSGPYHNAANLADDLLDKFEKFDAVIIKLTERDFEELTHKHCVDVENDPDGIFESTLNSKYIKLFRTFDDGMYRYSFVNLYPALHTAEVPYASCVEAKAAA